LSESQYLNAGHTSRAAGPRIQALQAALTKRLFRVFTSFVFSMPAVAAVPVAGEVVPIHATGYAWQLLEEARSWQLQVRQTGSTQPVARYALGDCRFCEQPGTRCDLEGIFGYLNDSVEDPLLGVICHTAAGRQRFSLFRPLKDDTGAFMRANVAQALDLWIEPRGIAVRYDGFRDDLHMASHWPRGFRPERPAWLSSPDPAALALHAYLHRVVNSRDSAALQAFIDEDSRLQGADGKVHTGRSGFARLWGLDGTAAPYAGPWQWLQSLLSAGVPTIEGGSLTYPALTTAEATSARLAIGTAVPVRAAPQTSAPIVARVSHAVLRAANTGRPEQRLPEGWLAVRTPLGRFGYVREDQVRPLDAGLLRLSARQGMWRISQARVGGR
jgi:hypothetical protein